MSEDVIAGVFAIFWFISLFCLLPLGIGADTDPGTGVPLSPRLGRKALIATASATILTAGFYALIALKVLDI